MNSSISRQPRSTSPGRRDLTGASRQFAVNCQPPVYRAHKARVEAANSRSQSGFTLLELLVVVAIIGLLVGYVAPRYFSQVGKSEVQVARAQLDAVEKALDQYRLDTRRYPTGEQGLTALVARPANEPNWAGPYLKRALPNDPWGRPYVYTDLSQKGSRGRARKDGRLNPINSDFDLYSAGPDGRTATPLGTPMSKDDIIRARDGAFLGLASDF